MSTLNITINEGRATVRKSLEDDVRMFMEKPPQSFVEKPLEGGDSDEAISRNIARLVDEGYEQDQATAIAYHNAGRGKSQKNAPTVNAVHTNAPLKRVSTMKDATEAADDVALVVAPTDLDRAYRFIRDKVGNIDMDITAMYYADGTACVYVDPEALEGAKQALDGGGIAYKVVKPKDAKQKPAKNTTSKSIVAKGRGRVLIVKGAPTAAERLRGEPFVGDDRTTIIKHLLTPLGLTLADATLAWCEDPAELDAFARAAAVDVVVSVDTMVRLDKRRDRWNFPPLRAFTDARYAPELTRKRLALRGALDTIPRLPACSVSVVSKGARPTLGTNDTAPHLAPIKKANKAKQIVYGVVLDPYVVDAHDDWIPPADIEDTAHEFMKRRVITLQHDEVAPDAQLVESFVEKYPTQSDYENAHLNKAHSAFASDYGSDRIHSGAWVIGVQLSDRLWKQYLDGEIGAFSIEGFGVRESVDQLAMPVVKFVELGQVGAVNGREDPKAILA